MIIPDLAPLATPVDQLALLPGNPRVGNVDEIANSLSRFGQRKPIVARRDGTVIAGNHTLLAARQLGWDQLAVVFVDDDATTADAFALADNRVGDLGGYDDEALLAMLEAVQADLVDDELREVTAWSEQDLAQLIATVRGSTDIDAEWRGMPDFEANSIMSVFHVVVHFASDKDADDFFAKIERPKHSSMWWPHDDGHVGRDSRFTYVAAADGP